MVLPKRHLASLTTLVNEDEPDIRALFAAVQRVARDVETAEGAASVLTNLGRYQDSKHLHVHVYVGEKDTLTDGAAFDIRIPALTPYE